MRRLLALIGLMAFITFVACEGTQADEGRDALIQVEDAQFFRSAMPTSEDGPKVLSTTLRSRARAGSVSQSAAGELERAASSVAIGLAGDVGYWVVPAGLPSPSAPDAPTFNVVFSVSERLTPGPRQVLLRGVSGDGKFGPPLVQSLDILGSEASIGRLVISLTWNNRADLDLHVVLPSGVEIFKRNPTEYERPPASAGPVPPGSPTDGGVLDRDSNAQCVSDGRRAENVVWTEAPPTGHYLVRVDTYSLCTEPNAVWRLEARLNGVRIGAAQGTSTENDLRFDHNRGGGVLALELDVP